MSGDELSTPLGVDLEPKKQSRSVPIGSVVLTLGLLLAGSSASFIIMTKDPLGGEPLAVANIERPKAVQPSNTAILPQNNSTTQLAQTDNNTQQNAQNTGRATAAEMETESGVKVVRQNGGVMPSAVVIKVPDFSTIKLINSPDRRLVEKNRHGVLPKLSSDGLRPLEIYARPVTPAIKSKPIRIAIVIGGLGIGQNVTSDAINRLPGEVTLAFAPYGADLERQAQRARDQGHELLLQAPMEPFDYPDNDPGPQTLLANQSAEQNLDRLHWLMSRFTGYVGVMNFMGARFSASDKALTPVFKDISSRGLAYLDDGSSQRSLSMATAGAMGLPAARADVTIDANLKSSDIDEALARLERMAKEKGVAIGVGSALPLTLDRVVRWSKSLEQKGIVLVPVSSIVLGSKS
jgi:uncharacterized protein